MKYLLSIIFVILGVVILVTAFTSFNSSNSDNYFTLPPGKFAGYEYQLEYRLNAANYDYKYLKTAQTPELDVTSKDGKVLRLLLLSTLYLDGNAENIMKASGFLKLSEDDNVISYIPDSTCEELLIPVRFIPGTNGFGSLLNSLTVGTHTYMLDFNTPVFDKKTINPYDYISCFPK